jgi:hypothetical protein
MPIRTLALRRESLSELAAGDLAAVAGAAAALPTTPVKYCVGVSQEASCLDCVTRFCEGANA